jgi:uncharacterized membrane protein SpoIIM required for sporulation
MDINEAFRSAYSALVLKPSKILPFYLMSVSVPAVIRIAPIITGVLVYYALLRRGNIEEIQAAIDELQTEGLGSPGSFEDLQGGGFGGEASDRLTDVLELVFVPEVIAIVGVSVVFFFLVSVFLNAVVSAGQVNAVYSVLVGGEPVRDGVGGAFSDTKAFALLLLLEAVLLLGSTAFFLLVGAAAVSLAGGVVAALLGIAVFLAWLLSVIVVHTVFIFAPQSIVIDGRGVVGGVKGGVGFVLDNPVEFVAYVIFAFAATIAFGSVAGFLNVLGAPAAVSVMGFVVFTPFIGVVKTDMYTRHAGDEVTLEREASLSLDAVVSALRRGLDEMASFTVSNLHLVAVSALLFVGAGAAVWEYTVAADVGVETSISDRKEQLSPVGGFLNLAANNWSVAVAQSYAGFVFGFATLVSLVFNGAAIGFVAATETDLLELVAFVVPHGIIEIPSLLISGALGIHLGLVAVRYFRGGLTVGDVTGEVERAYNVLIGLLLLFVVAGLIEGFFSPYYYEFILGL